MKLIARRLIRTTLMPHVLIITEVAEYAAWEVYLEELAAGTLWSRNGDLRIAAAHEEPMKNASHTSLPSHGQGGSESASP